MPQLAAATHPGWWLIAGYGCAIVALGYVSTTGFAKETALRVAAAA
jgi:hypothetical protein